MKRSTKALLTIFVVVAVGLYVYLFAVPEIEGMSERTAVLEHGELPVLDKAEVLIIRDETLFGSKKSGAVTREQEEGTKVRKKVRLITVEGGAPAATNAAVEQVKQIAAGSMKMTGSYKATRTAVVSYYADGYEKALSPKKMGALKKSDLDTYPARGESIAQESVAAGDPVYKLTNNNEWFLVYWVGADGDTSRYATGSAVTVKIGGDQVDATVYDVTQEGGSLKVILRSDMYYEGLERVRRADAEIVFAEYTGLVADVSCIAVRDGATGVYVKQRAGGYKWVPVKVQKETGGRCTLAAGVYYDEAGEQVITVDYYDEVLLNPEQSGQVE
jgi:putative membrane fusion protein